jgi:superfamily II DNA or RNA helicase
MPEPNEQGISEQQEQIDEEVFSDGDYLKLLQLEARQSIKQRRASKDNFRLTSSGVPNSFPSQDEIIPKLWRLVPEGVTPYQWQEECLQKWMDANCRGTVKVATGGGKTLFALLAAQTLQNQKRPDLRVAIVVPTIPLMNQWRDEMSKGNLPSSAFALMGGGNQVEDLSVYRIVIAVLNSAREKLPELVQKAEWSSRMLLVVDECHRAEAEQARRIFDSKPAYTLGLSATPEPGLEYEDVPPDDSYNQSVIGQNIGPIIYEFSLQDSLNAGLLTPFEVWHIGFPLTHEEQVRHDDLSRKISDLKKGLEARYRKSRSKQGFIAWCQTVAKRNTPEAEDAQQFIGLANQRKRLLYRARARQDLTLAILSEPLCSMR